MEALNDWTHNPQKFAAAAALQEKASLPGWTVIGAEQRDSFLGPTFAPLLNFECKLGLGS